MWVVGGGDLVGQFDDAGLLDEVQLGMTPVTLGAGPAAAAAADHLEPDALPRGPAVAVSGSGSSSTSSAERTAQA